MHRPPAVYCAPCAIDSQGITTNDAGVPRLLHAMFIPWDRETQALALDRALDTGWAAETAVRYGIRPRCTLSSPWCLWVHVCVCVWGGGVIARHTIVQVPSGS